MVRIASSKIKGINIKIGADTTGLDTALKKIENSGKSTRSELSEINRAIKHDSDSVVLWSQKQELLTKAIEDSRKKLEFLLSAQEQVKRQFENGEIDGGQYRAFQREIESTRHNIQNLNGQLAESNQRLQECGEQAENSANGGYTVLGNVFANVITEGIKLAGTALQNFTQDIITTGEEYESAISNVVAISGAMAEEVEMLQEKAEKMGATTKFTASESAEAMSYMAMAGWKVNDMISGLDGIMDLSSASGESLASVADIVTDALTAFGLTAGDSAHFADVLAAASSNANTNVAMMGETFKYAAPVSGAFGFSIEDTAEAIGLMANSGIKASQAGTSLRTILTNLSRDVTIYGEAFKSANNAAGEYIVTTTNADGSMRDLSDILADLRAGWEHLTEAEQAQNATMETIAGKNAMSGFLALMNAGTADIEKLSTAIENADGTAKAMSETMLDNLQGDRTLFESAFDGVKIAVSKELNPALRDLTQYATSQIPKIQKAIEPVADFVTKAIKAVPKLVDGLQKVSPVLVTIGYALLNIGALSLMPKITSFCTTTIPTVILPAIKGLFATVSAHPFVAVAVAVSSLTAGLFNYLNKQLDVKSETELLIEKHNDETQALIQKRQAVEDLNDAFYENVDGIQNQTDRTKDLWEELDKLADQYGNVQQKDKARAEYILSELNNALGTEYTMTGNQIDNYRQLSAEIDNVIAKKQAEMLIDSYLANSVEITKQRTEARSDYEKYDREYAEKKKIVEDLERQYKELTGSSAEEITKETDKDKAFEKIDFITSQLYGGKHEISDIAKQIWSARDEAMQSKTLRLQAEKTYNSTSEYFENLNDLQEAYSLGQYERMSEIIFAEKDLTGTTLDESATSAEERLEIYSENLQKTLSDFQLAVKDMKQTSVDELEKEFASVMQSGAVAGVDPLETWGEFKKDVLDFQANGLDISPLISTLANSGISPAEAFGSDWQEVFRTQLKNGGDMDSMLKWLDNSEYYASISSIFGDNQRFIEYIKKQSGQGIDVSSLLELGIKSGLSESDEFVKIFKSNISKSLKNGWDVGNLLELGNQWGIDLGAEFGESFGSQMETLSMNGVDLTEFIKWAEKNGKSIAEVFGENFQNELSEYLKSEKLTNIKNNFSMGSFVYTRLFGGEFDLTDRLIKKFANGGDVSALVRQARKQGLKVGDVFGDSYTDVIQQQIDKKYDITELLEWGEESGVETGTMLGRNYTNEVQDFVDKNFSIVSLLEWAEKSGKSAGEVFGKSFHDIADSYMKYVETTQTAENAGNIVANQIGNIFNNLPFMANGGFLSNGRAVVAEAGPELLEVMNGGVRVTPLSENSRNTAINSAGQKIFYSNYTINATIAGGYDVSRLAEDLESEKRRIEMGLGK
ncbi:MAG: phage tail tape measure protein [Ruminococcus flavefaciens]|nr:phage tail tape measure protein [Ruminococcus flavefaciens]